MRTRHLYWYVAPFFTAMMVLFITLCSWFVARHLKEYQLNALQEDLKAKSLLVAERFTQAISDGKLETIDEMAKEVGRLTQARVTVVLKDGRVAGDSMVEKAILGDLSERPEILMSLANHIGMDIRQSRVMNDHMLYIAVPLSDQEMTAGALRLSVSIEGMDRALKTAYVLTALFAGIGAILSLAAGLWVSKRVTGGLEAMRSGVTAWIQGDLPKPLSGKTIHGIGEIAGLNTEINQVMTVMNQRIENANRRRAEIEAVLASMTEGVLAIDDEENIIINNQAVCRILDRNVCDFVGKKLHNVVRDTRFRRFVDSAVVSGSPISADIEMTLNTEKVLRCHGTALKGVDGANAGTVFVLDDVTHLKLLENIRRDFAVNVSHEIKTPLTAIKGFVETLIEMGGHEEESLRFLSILEKNVRRLERIIEDLVDLSRIENEEDGSHITLTEESIKPVIERAMAGVAGKAGIKEIALKSVCDADLMAQINPQLLERALSNLIVNAVTYSDRGKSVVISAGLERGRLAIRVKDHGVGIEKKHQARIFERFYRVDEARSRDTGGTGLGLALVKHIVKVHGGEISLRSELGKGSEFTIRLPVQSVKAETGEK